MQFFSWATWQLLRLREPLSMIWWTVATYIKMEGKWRVSKCLWMPRKKYVFNCGGYKWQEYYLLQVTLPMSFWENSCFPAPYGGVCHNVSIKIIQVNVNANDNVWNNMFNAIRSYELLQILKWIPQIQ